MSSFVLLMVLSPLFLLVTSVLLVSELVSLLSLSGFDFDEVEDAIVVVVVVEWMAICLGEQPSPFLSLPNVLAVAIAAAVVSASFPSPLAAAAAGFCSSDNDDDGSVIV